ncbi:MAG: hypothetical protein JOS17DRAFT_826221 [Linnemannia elongata]|nr:MAG: hypothetical protein JOS17DRAFT_826221 [Linnemannia elongata]
MVSTVSLILAPVLIGAIIFGTTVLLSPSNKPNVNDIDPSNITTIAQLITTVLIPDKVATVVTHVFTTPPAIVTIPPIVPSITTKDNDLPSTTTKALPHKPVKEVPPSSPSPSKSKLETITAEEAAVVSTLSLRPTPSTTTSTESPTPTKSDITLFRGITVPNPFDLFKPAEPPKSTTAITATTTTAAVVAPTTTTTIAKEVPTTTYAKTTITTIVANPIPTKAGITVFPGITIPNPLDFFNPAEPPKPITTATTTTADIDAITTAVTTETPKPTATAITETKTTREATTTTTSTSSTLTKSRTTIFPGVAKEVPRTTPTMTTTTTVPATIVASPSPTKRPRFALFPGITLPNPFDFFPHGHPGGETESLVDDITKENEHVEIGNQVDIEDERDGQHQDKEDADEYWKDEEVQHKEPNKMGRSQKVLRQRSLKRVRGHHHHRQRTQRAQLVRRQKLSLHDVIQIARNITVSPPVKTLHLFSGSSTTTTTVATNPTILPHPVVYSDRKDTVIKDTDPKKEEKLSTPLQSPPVSNAESAPPASSQGAHERDTKDSVLQEIEFAIDKLVDAQTESFEGSLNLIVNNLIQSDEIESYQDLLFESIAVSKLEIPESSDDDSTLDFDTDDQPVFQGPRTVSRFSILSSILNTFLPPFILRFRTDLRNFLFWICSRNASAYIDGKDASGDDTWAKKVAQDDINNLIHPDGSIDLKSIWDPRIGALGLECIKGHAQVFWNEVSSLVGTRFIQTKEFLVGQLRGLIGVSQFSSSSVPTENATIGSPDQNQEEKEQQHQEKQQKQGKLSPASDQAYKLKAIQRIEATSDKADGFVKWFVDTMVNELQDVYFADAKAPAVSRVETQPSGREDDGAREAGERICAWMKERVKSVL